VVSRSREGSLLPGAEEDKESPASSGPPARAPAEGASRLRPPETQTVTNPAPTRSCRRRGGAAGSGGGDRSGTAEAEAEAEGGARSPGSGSAWGLEGAARPRGTKP
jgi:hypothetical protein